MDEKTRRKIEMGKRALKFRRAAPDSDPEYSAAAARLEALLARARELELKEEKERSRRRMPEAPGREVKVIPFRRRPVGEPPEPAA